MTEPTPAGDGRQRHAGACGAALVCSRGTHRVVGTVRNDAAAAPLRAQMPHAELRTGVDATNLRDLRALFDEIKPGCHQLRRHGQATGRRRQPGHGHPRQRDAAA